MLTLRLVGECIVNKIPVGATVARAYGFAFGNIVNNLGAIWIPATILYVLTFLFRDRYINATFDLMTRDPQSMIAGMRFLRHSSSASFS
jgi:hypothetical protein